MKKVFALFLSLTLFVVCSSAIAEATHRRGVIEFCELHMYRFMKLQHDTELNYDIHILEPNSMPHNLDNTTILLNSAAGSMEVNTTDYTVSGITMTFIDLDASDADNERNAMSCMMALSALEYNEMDDLKFQINSKLSGGAESAIEESLRILADEWSDKLVDIMGETVETGKEVKIYSGNYDYYVAYYAGQRKGSNFEYYYLIARAHE